MGEVSAPTILTIEHSIESFSCGNDALDEWLQKQSLKNQDNGASKTFVICSGKTNAIGFYALASGSVERKFVTNNFSRGMPEPIPVIILGRLAIDRNYQGNRLGAQLLRDALLRSVNTSRTVGIRGILVHAISEQAKSFYLNYGFRESPFESMTLFISIKDIIRHIA